ncbi:ABC transporter substrate-binding protein [Mesorhizobium sp. NBSH29]|uniref:branched-chain amino acid ABC transporter substrate-binding protein n=1 Tax=Mesorhizobium sp. NBSH29 TaxID=2654249 RepID=UPI00189678A7|nr:branched-chain amino acid ABC transporter substrate-binding protein [Mesorhizobium sp. NBSH29]QPC87892.1 ABC transporter substrate-binding protein [Mesorhizobium sp. NBSH29]
MASNTLPVLAADARIGLAAPFSGTASLLGGQIHAGVTTAIGAHSSLDLEIADDACTAEGGAKAANQFVTTKVSIVVGFLCTEALEAAMPILKLADIPVITIGARTDSLTDLRDKTGWPLFRLAPRASAEQAAAASLIPALWRESLFAIIDDGTIYGRELASSVRAGAEARSLKPVFTDTFRPDLDNQVGLVGRLRKAGTTHLFVGGERSDIAIIARDARKLGLDLTIAGGEALRSAPGDVPLEPGILMLGLPNPADEASAEALALLEARKIEPDGYVLPAFAAVEIAAAALLQVPTGSPLSETLGKTSFTTALGQIQFDAKGDLKENPYRLYRYNGMAFVEAGD